MIYLNKIYWVYCEHTHSVLMQKKNGIIKMENTKRETSVLFCVFTEWNTYIKISQEIKSRS